MYVSLVGVTKKSYLMHGGGKKINLTAPPTEFKWNSPE